VVDGGGGGALGAAVLTTRGIAMSLEPSRVQNFASSA
jgi:hypothetical protein